MPNKIYEAKEYRDGRMREDIQNTVNKIRILTKTISVLTINSAKLSKDGTRHCNKPKIVQTAATLLTGLLVCTTMRIFAVNIREIFPKI